MTMEQKPESKALVEIVEAAPEDVRGMQEVYQETWLDTYPDEEAGITREDIEDFHKDILSEKRLAERAEQVAHPKEGHTILLAKEGSKVVGVCYLITSGEQNRLRSLYVRPGYQGKGVGRKLWAEAKKRLDPGKETMVSVATYNKKAIDFYEKLGFRDTGRRFSDERFRMKSGNVIPQMEMKLETHEEQ